jgi:SpoIID/LytB domain protein
MKFISFSKRVVGLFLPLLSVAFLVACSRPSDAFFEPQSLKILNVEDPVYSQQLETIRVKIFPHHSAYNAPHGKDKILHRFLLTTKGSCSLFAANSGSSEDGTRGQFISKGASFSFSTANFEGPYWLDCDQPATLHREDIPKENSYAGHFFLKKIGSGNSAYITVINVLPFEEYLRGVVPAEMPASWAKEALKAQAVAARTYAYFEVVANVAKYDPNLVKEESGAQLDDTVTYQAYLGLSNANKNTDEALKATDGELMLYKGKIVKAFFHADSGGHTEDSKNVWGLDLPYILGKPEIYEPGSVPNSSWKLEQNIANIQRAMIAHRLIPSNSQIEGLWVNPKDLLPSTRPSFISLTLKTGDVKKVTAVEFAYALGLRSPWIQFSGGSAAANTIFLEGKVYGHGAGMNQWGARIMADKFRKTYQEILQFYYTDINIAR